MAHENQNVNEYDVCPHPMFNDTQPFVCCYPTSTVSDIIQQTEEHAPDDKQIVQMQRKCHGNRKLQRFKRKCRRRGWNEQQICFTIEKRSHVISESCQNDHTVHEQPKQFNKRKRIDQSKENLLESSIKSMSQLSISQQALKRIEHSTSNDKFNQNEIIFYKPSRYLKMSRKLLLHSLRLQLRCSLKKKKEQKFIFEQTTVMDRQFCLNQLYLLYQRFYSQGEQHQVWLVSMLLRFSFDLNINDFAD